MSYDTVQQAVHRLTGKRTILALEPTSLDAILATVTQVGDATGHGDRAAALVHELRQRIDHIAAITKEVPRLRQVFAMEWLDPPFTAGHWVPEMIRLAGGRDDSCAGRLALIPGRLDSHRRL